MGYETRYSLGIIDDDNLIPITGVDANGNKATIFIKKEEEIGIHMNNIQILSGYNYLFEESCKWYEHETQMREYSKNYPRTVFVLEGEGEESGDLWLKYFKNGRVQVCKAIIKYDKFDELKMS